MIIMFHFLWKVNTWGYSTINFFSPMSRYAGGGGGPLKASWEFKEMVKALHGAGIEVNRMFSDFGVSIACSWLEVIFPFLNL